MNEPAPEPKPKRSRRMVVWMVAVPIVILLLALAGANWKRFHLAYAKHLVRSEDYESRVEGVEMIVNTHLRKGMKLEEVCRLLHPVKLRSEERPGDNSYGVQVDNELGGGWYISLPFDDEDRLRYSPGP